MHWVFVGLERFWVLMVLHTALRCTPWTFTMFVERFAWFLVIRNSLL